MGFPRFVRSHSSSPRRSPARDYCLLRSWLSRTHLVAPRSSLLSLCPWPARRMYLQSEQRPSLGYVLPSPRVDSCQQPGNTNSLIEHATSHITYIYTTRRAFRTLPLTCRFASSPPPEPCSPLVQSISRLFVLPANIIRNLSSFCLLSRRSLTRRVQKYPVAGMELHVSQDGAIATVSILGQTPLAFSRIIFCRSKTQQSPRFASHPKRSARLASLTDPFFPEGASGFLGITGIPTFPCHADRPLLAHGAKRRLCMQPAGMHFSGPSHWSWFRGMHTIRQGMNAQKLAFMHSPVAKCETPGIGYYERLDL